MRKSRMLLAFLLSALTLLAIAAPASFAQEEEPIDEALVEEMGSHCANNVAPVAHAVTGGCQIHLLMEFGTFMVFVHTGMTEALVANCKVELRANIGPTGEGWISNQNFTNPVGGMGCGANGLRACTEPGGNKKLWHMNVYEDMVAGTLYSKFEVCISGPTGELNGDIRVDIGPIGGGRYGWEMIDADITEGGASAIEIEAHWVNEVANIAFAH